MQNQKLIHGFKKVDEKIVNEINASAHRYFHVKSGAELLHFENDDSNKVFIIGFKTPPDNSRGIPHILEHCVLNGSRKFKCKEPFVELLKGSMQTFTNAMTYPDKTVYPIASTNDKDFFNLMDVYLDAVFFPNIYSDPNIFRQEGWHYELNQKDEELNIKGVVFNEMEGAFSSPEQILFRTVRKSLLKNTIYSHESGGDPDHIPELSYEEFTAFHKKYYHPSNSKIILYGNGNINQQLKFINDGFLDQFDSKKMIFQNWEQEKWLEKKSVVLDYPLSADEDEGNKAYLNLSYLTASNLDPETLLGMEILEHILLGTPASPLKNTLLKSKLGKDVFGHFQYELLQPIFSITVKHADLKNQEKFERIIHDSLTYLVKNGINERIIQASINSKEFELREAEFGSYPKGLIFGLSALSYWMYFDNPIEILEFESPLKSIKEKMKNGYFESLIQTYFLTNPHSVSVTLNPKKGLTESRTITNSKKLNQIKSELTENEINSIINQTQSLKERQIQKDSEEDLKSIPLLKLSDLNPKSEEIKISHESIGSGKVLLHTGNTRGISYIKYYFDISMIQKEDLPYLSLLSGLLGKISTKNYSYDELSNEILFHTGGIGFSMNTYQIEGSQDFLPKFVVYTKAVHSKINDANRLITEILNSTTYDDRVRLRGNLQEMKSRMEMSIMNSGHQIAETRLLSYINPIGMYHEIIAGLEFYRFISRLDKQFDLEYESIKANLNRIALTVFNKENMVSGLITDEIKAHEKISDIGGFLSKIPQNEIEPVSSEFTPNILNEGLATPARVQYVASGFNFKQLGFEYSGAISVFSRIAGLNYLWNKVRVQGGAYGSFVSVSRNGDIVFLSYRDPNLQDTLEAFKGMSQFLTEFNPTHREMRKYIIGSMSTLDKPLTPPMKGSLGVSRYFRQINSDMIQTHREEVLSANQSQIRDMAGMVKSVLDKNVICVVGNEGNLQKEKSIFGDIVSVFD